MYSLLTIIPVRGDVGYCMCRIPWTVPSDAYQNSTTAPKLEDGGGARDEAAHDAEGEAGDGAETDIPAVPVVTQPLIDPKDNRCEVLWQGILAKRTFHGFKFQVSVISYHV